MRQFKVYLKAELGKLKHRGDARNFLSAGSPELLEKCGLGIELEALVTQLSSQEKVNNLVAGLSDIALRELTRHMDENCRRNGVFKKLSATDKWFESEVEVSRVLVQQAEPHLKDLWRECNYELMKVAMHPKVIATEPYCANDRSEPIAFRMCLAKRIGDRYCIFDGVHRAIQLFRNGENTIPLCWAVEK
jgi:hypothetical protein